MDPDITFENLASKLEKYDGPLNKYIVLTWWAELSETNFESLKHIIEIIVHAPQMPLPKLQIDEIKKLGNQIYRRGGLDSLNACYNILGNFMTTRDAAIDAKILETTYVIWCEIGDFGEGGEFMKC
jgi:hypothetical protein